MVKPLPMVTVEGIEYGIVYFGKNVTFESFEIFEAWANVVERVVAIVVIVVAIVVAIVVEFILAQLKKLKLKYIFDRIKTEYRRGNGNKIATSSLSVERILVLSFAFSAKKIQKWQSG